MTAQRRLCAQASPMRALSATASISGAAAIPMLVCDRRRIMREDMSPVAAEGEYLMALLHRANDNPNHGQTPRSHIRRRTFVFAIVPSSS
jgi:hypothetical protein